MKRLIAALVIASTGCSYYDGYVAGKKAGRTHAKVVKVHDATLKPGSQTSKAVSETLKTDTQ